jgi:cell division GTPase FtsZ
MRILALGLGGAGCRIVARLFEFDRHSSKVTCVQALAIDIDASTLAQLDTLPDRVKLYFPAMEPDMSRSIGDGMQRAKVDIDEITSRIQSMDLSETDAIFICCGLGGSLVDIAPKVIAALRATTVEPIFGLVTLPCLSEGGKRSAKAADDIEMLSPLLDGVILFDNETWSQRMPPLQEKPAIKGFKRAGIFGLKKKQKKEMSPQDYLHMMLNEGIVRRISLILRAGEFKADGGLDLAEVVMDSGEVLNTIKGMGFITIGYAVQPLSPHPLSFLSRLRPANLFSDEANKSASRIVELAKQAIYQEISAPCDITSADKALILIAGPSYELSMKGFMTVRKWIDRSIAGLETRSGDYPVTNTKYVAIIIMLSGLENIPRLTELKEIREQYKAGVLKATTEELKSRKETLTGLNISDTGRMPADISILPTDLEKKDEMIVLPIKKANSGSGGRRSLQKPAMRSGYVDEERQQHSGGDTSGISPAPAGKAGKSPAGEMNEKVVTPISAVSPVSPSDITTHREPGAHRPSRTVIPAASGSGSSGDEQIARGASREATERSALKMSDHMKSRELDRKRIERELQRQRMVAIGGRREQQQEPATEPSRPPSHGTEDHKTIIRRISRTKPESMAPGSDDVTAKPAQPPPRDEKTIIRIKKRAPLNEGGMAQKREDLPDNGSGNGLDLVNHPAEYLAVATPDEEKIGLKDRRPQTRDDDILKGKLVLKKDTSHVKDDALLHTDLKTRKSPAANETSTEQSSRVPNGTDTARPRKKEDRPAPDDKDELSWI